MAKFYSSILFYMVTIPVTTSSLVVRLLSYILLRLSLIIDGRPRLGHKAHFCCRKMVTQLSQNLWWPNPWWWDNLSKLSINSFFPVFSQKGRIFKKFLRALTILLPLQKSLALARWLQTRAGKETVPQLSDSESRSNELSQVSQGAESEPNRWHRPCHVQPV